MADVTEEDKQKIRDKIQKLKESKFKQQTLPAWRPVPTAMSTLITFSIFSVIFIGMGAILFQKSSEIKEQVVQYSVHADCKKTKVSFPEKFGDKTFTKNKCIVPFEITDDNKMGSKVFAYYQLDNFYQNHRRYVKSRDNGQLAGKYSADPKDLNNCDPIQKVQDLWPSQRYAFGDARVKL